MKTSFIESDYDCKHVPLNNQDHFVGKCGALGCLYRTERLAKDIVKEFGQEPITCLCVLKGGYQYVMW